jgi:hypothetical protein
MPGEDRRLTGARIPRGVDLDGPEASSRIQRVVRQLQAKAPADPWRQAYLEAVEAQNLRQRGFTAEDRAKILEWLERISSRE